MLVKLCLPVIEKIHETCINEEILLLIIYTHEDFLLYIRKSRFVIVDLSFLTRLDHVVR